MLNKKALMGSVSAPPSDEYFKNTVLLLHGDGTNGAQNNTFLDSSTNAFSITRNGNTTQGTFSPFSQTGWSNYFDGSGDWLTVTNTGNYATAFGTGDFTVEFWIYPTASFGTFVNIYDSRGTNDDAVMIRISSGNITYYSFGADNISATAPSINTWSHIALSRVSGSSRLYINGSQVGSTYTDSRNYGNESVISIGGRNNDGANAYTGYISNLRVVNGGGLYSGSTITVPTSPLSTSVSSGTVRLLTCQANRFVDSSSSALAITVNGNTSVQAFSPFAPTAAYSAATNGGSGYFDGTGDYLSTSTSQIIPTGSFTIEAWVYTTSPNSTTKKIVSQGTSGNSGRTDLGIEGSAWWFQIGDDYVNAGTPVLGQWNYVAMTFNGSTLQGYVNGVSQGSISHTGNAQNTTLSIGTNWNNAYWNGYIASLRISNTVRTVTSVPTSPFASDANTSFLCNFTNAGIIDNTAKNDLETVGNAQIDTGTKKFGTGSLEFDGTGDYIWTKASNQDLNVGGGDFTIEGWFYLNSTPSTMGLFQMSNTVGGFAANQTKSKIVLGSPTFHFLRGSIHDFSILELF